MKNTVLIVDDDVYTLQAREMFLRRSYSVLTATSVSQAKTIARRQEIDVVLVDLAFEGQDEDGLDLIDYMVAEHSKTSIIVLSGDDETRRVSNAMRRPIVDFIAKDEDDLETILKSTIERALERRIKLEPVPGKFSYQTKSPAMNRVLEHLDRVVGSSGNSSILIIGESGTGKEFLAKHIAARTSRRLVSANMATISRELAESTLFGHVKGAFTGASASRTGLFEQAHGGLLFLDEIGECPLDVQAKLLRALQEREIQPVGSNSTKRIDVRFIAATNRNLEAMVAAGTFRLDLYQRLNTFIFRVPALRSRPEDVAYYTNQFLNEFTDGSAHRLTTDGLDALLQYQWPGNIRELRSVVERCIIYSNSRTLDGEAITNAIGSVEPASKPRSSSANRTIYLQALEKSGFNRARAARLLGINVTTLYRNLKAWGLQDHLPSLSGRPKELKGNTR